MHDRQQGIKWNTSRVASAAGEAQLQGQAWLMCGWQVRNKNSREVCRTGEDSRQPRQYLDGSPLVLGGFAALHREVSSGCWLLLLEDHGRLCKSRNSHSIPGRHYLHSGHTVKVGRDRMKLWCPYTEDKFLTSSSAGHACFAAAS